MFWNPLSLIPSRTTPVVSRFRRGPGVTPRGCTKEKGGTTCTEAGAKVCCSDGTCVAKPSDCPDFGPYERNPRARRGTSTRGTLKSGGSYVALGTNPLARAAKTKPVARVASTFKWYPAMMLTSANYPPPAPHDPKTQAFVVTYVDDSPPRLWVRQRDGSWQSVPVVVHQSVQPGAYGYPFLVQASRPSQLRNPGGIGCTGSGDDGSKDHLDCDNPSVKCACMSCSFDWPGSFGQVCKWIEKPTEKLGERPSGMGITAAPVRPQRPRPQGRRARAIKRLGSGSEARRLVRKGPSVRHGDNICCCYNLDPERSCKCYSDDQGKCWPQCQYGCPIRFN